ncbi:MAG: hypothetical protein IKY83_06090, partial [Proteobacteria bacterium]|nr:hypothetical protein [Pseudomonadota bacterium]
MNDQNFSEIEKLSKIALESGDLTKLQNLLVPLVKEEDSTRSASENLFVYRTLGTLYREQDQPSEAHLAYEQAYSYDARDRETLEVLVEEELRKSPEEMDTSRLMALLVLHRDTLKPTAVMRIFKAFGDVHAAKGELILAREYYEKGLIAKPGEMALINALLKVSEESGDDQAIIKSREKLLETMTTPESRAAVLVSIGDDYLNRKKDEAQALVMYEEALAECAQSRAALQHIVVIAGHNSDWERALDALNRLVKITREDDEKCKYLIKIAWIFKEKLGNVKRTIQVFNEILDIRPDQSDVFNGLISLIQSQKDIDAEDENIVRMIERMKANDITKGINRLYKRLGEIRISRNDLKGAIEVYRELSELYPDDKDPHIMLSKLYMQSDDTLEEAIRENRQVLRVAPYVLDAVNALAKCYSRLDKLDESVCVCRVLDVLNRNDAEGKALLADYADSDIPKINGRIPENLWRFILPSTLDLSLLRILQICTPLITTLFKKELSDFNIREKDARIDTSTNSMFITIFRNIAKSLSYAEIPLLYRCDLSGMTNAYQDSRALLINPNFLKMRRAQEIAFASAKALLLIRPEYYMLQYCIPSDKNAEMPKKHEALQQIIEAIFKTVCPTLNIKLNATQELIAKKLEQSLTPQHRNVIIKNIQDITKRNMTLNIQMFMESVEDFCNRVGLLF